MLDCPNCKSDKARKLIGTDQKIFCNDCFEQKNYSPTYLHSYESQDGKTKVSWAKAEVIKNRTICPDDKRTVIDRRTKKETQY